MASDKATQLGAPDDTAARPLMPQAVLVNGTYEIDRRIAVGGMGEVWRAHNTVTGAPCAIKVIRPELVADEFVASLFKREAEALKTIRDSAVVGYEGAFRDEHGRLFLVMQYVDGPSLAEYMRERPLAVPEVIMLLGRLARGLAAAHAVGVYHRDLSPDNILLPGGKLEEAVICDFGIAKRIAPGGGPTVYGTERKGFTGKYSYASPEQAGTIDAPVDHRSDIYSLGLVLAAAARGRPLPMGDDPHSAKEARRKRPDLSSLPRPLQPILSPLLTSDPRERTQTMQEVMKMVASPPSSPARWLRWAGIAAVGAAVAGAVLLMTGDPPPPPLILTDGERPVAEPAPVPPEPSVVDTSRIEDDLHRLVLAQSCARVQGRVAQDGSVTLVGSVTSEEAKSSLLATASNLPGVSRVSDRLVILPAAHCQAAEAIAQLVGPMHAGAPRIRLNKPDGVFSAARDVFTAVVSAPPDLGGHLYVDYFHENGEVYHLLPEELTPLNRVEPGGSVAIGRPAEQAKPSERVWRLGAPFGAGRITVILSEKPLYDGLRPIGESAADYLNFLHSALPAVNTTGRVVMNDVAIETRP